MIKYISIFRLVLRCILVARKENSTGFSTGLTGRSKNLDPTGRSTRPVSISEPQLVLNFTWACKKRFIFHGGKQICTGKSSSYLPFNCFNKTIACCHYIQSISSHCRLHFSLVHYPKKITSTKFALLFEGPAHRIPNQTEIATEEFCPKSLLQKLK